MNRAVAITQPQHAITADLRQLLHKNEDTASEMERLAHVHGEERVNAGIEALLVALLELLSRLIGDEMSARILDALPTAEDPRALKESE